MVGYNNNDYHNKYMRDKTIYIKTIAISEKDLKYMKELKNKIGGKKSLAGILSQIINSYEKRC